MFQDRTDRVHLQGVQSLGLLTLRRFCCFGGLRARERGSLITARATSISKRLSTLCHRLICPTLEALSLPPMGHLMMLWMGRSLTPHRLRNSRWMRVLIWRLLCRRFLSTLLGIRSTRTWPTTTISVAIPTTCWDYWTRHGWLDAMVASQAGRGDDVKTSASKANTASPSRSWHCRPQA